MRVLDAIADLLNRKSSVQMVADDPQMSAELLLLIRTMFADGEMNEKEVAAFQDMCSSVFEIPSKDVPEVIRFLKDYGYETSSEQSAALFADMPKERKSELVSRLLVMAMADAKFHDREKAMITRVAQTVGLSDEDMRALS
ncbi:MAG: TerB family tellurite resistance protein [Ahrensia sp.]|nr:TerB family tellurite resistance protein [Ahrensia sp.]